VSFKGNYKNALGPKQIEKILKLSYTMLFRKISIPSSI